MAFSQELGSVRISSWGALLRTKGEEASGDARVGGWRNAGEAAAGACQSGGGGYRRVVVVDSG